MLSSSISVLRVLAKAVLWGAFTGTVAPLMGQPHVISNGFTTDTRHVFPQSECVTSVFPLDTRARDGVIGFAVSGSTHLDTGGHLMDVPLVQGISPEVVPGLEERQWVTILGLNFASGARVVLRTGDEVFAIPAARTQVVSATEIRVYVNVTSEPAEWTVQVGNPGGVLSTAQAFTVGAVPVTPLAGLEFGRTEPGTVVDKSFTLRNGGTTPVPWSASVVGQFTLLEAASGSLVPGGTVLLPVRYAPAQTGAHEGLAVINIGGRLHYRNLSGRAAANSETGTGFSGSVVVDGAATETFVANATVRLYPLLASRTGFQTRTDVIGRFSFSSVPPGYYELVALPPAGSRALDELRVSVEIQAGSAPVTVRLPPRSIDDAEPTDMPVVLVRGIGERGVDEPAYWQAMRIALCADGFTVWDPNESDVLLNGEMSFYDNATFLRQYVLTKVTEFRAQNLGISPPGLHIVGHSMGGLTARQMISVNHLLRDSSQKLPPIRTLITLSTPHAGSLLANGSHHTKLWPRYWDSTRSLDTDLVRDMFRPVWPNDPRLRLYVAGGNTPIGTDGLSLTAAGAVLSAASPAQDQVSDGAVTWLSSKGIYYKKQNLLSRLVNASLMGPLYLVRYDLIYEPHELFPAGRTTATPELLNLNHTDIKQHAEAIRWVTDRLLGRTSSELSGASGLVAIPLEESEQQANKSVHFTEMVADEMPAEEGAEEGDWQEVDFFTTSVVNGTPVVLSAPLTGLGSARWVVHVASAEVEIRLGMPGGSWLTEAGPGVEWLVVDLGGGERQVTITLEAPAAGTWALELSAPTTADPVACAVAVFEQGGPVLEVEPHQRVPVGRAVTLLAAALDVEAVEGEVEPIPGGVVEARITPPGVSAVTRALHDDGQQSDGAANDGVHGLTSAEFNEPGLHDVELRFDGALPGDGPVFRRLARTSFLRAYEGGFVVGIEGHQAIDADADGWPEAVVLEVRVDNAVPGAFALLGTLTETEGGARLEAMSELERDEAGDGRVNLVFDTRDLPQGRECGPFQVAELRLLRMREAGRDWLHDHPPGYAVPVRMFNGHARFLRVSGEFDFGRVRVGQSATRTLLIHNDGWSPLQVEGLSLPEGFIAVFAGEIEPGGEQEVEVTFVPLTPGIYGGVFEVTSDATAGEAEHVWTGEGYVPLTLNEWLGRSGVPLELRGPDQDANGDGVPNLLAFLFGLEHEEPPTGNSALPLVRMMESGGKRFLALRHRQNPEAEGVAVEMQWSSSLEPGSWVTIQPDETVDAGVDSASGIPLRELRVHLSGDALRGFVRLQLSEGG